MFSPKTFEKLSHPDPEVRAKRQTFAYIALLAISLVWLFFSVSAVFEVPKQAGKATHQMLMDWDQGLHDVAKPLLMLLISGALLSFVLKIGHLSGVKKVGATVGVILWTLIAGALALIASSVVNESARAQHEAKFAAMGFSSCGDVDAVKQARLKSGAPTLRETSLAVYQKDCSSVDISFNETMQNYAVQATVHPQMPEVPMIENDHRSTLGLKLCSSASSPWANRDNVNRKDPKSVYLLEAYYRAQCD